MSGSSNFQIYPGKTDNGPPWSNMPDKRVNFLLFSFTWVNLMIDPPVKPARPESEIFAFQLYLGKSYDRPPWYQTEAKAVHFIQLYILSSFIFCHLELSNWTGQSCIYFYRKFLSISL